MGRSTLGGGLVEEPSNHQSNVAGNHSEAKQVPVHEELEIQTCNGFIFIEDVTCHSVIVSSIF